MRYPIYPELTRSRLRPWTAPSPDCTLILLQTIAAEFCDPINFGTLLSCFVLPICSGQAARKLALFFRAQLFSKLSEYGITHK